MKPLKSFEEYTASRLSQLEIRWLKIKVKAEFNRLKSKKAIEAI
jgi:hypothetical protein